MLLRYAADRVKRGGRIVYSTCSIEPEENEQVVDEFLRQHSGFHLVAGKGSLASFSDAKGQINLRGPEIEGDGVFAARLERKP